MPARAVATVSCRRHAFESEFAPRPVQRAGMAQPCMAWHSPAHPNTVPLAQPDGLA